MGSMRVLGIDYGARRIGVALGDTETRVASPWAVLEVARLEALQKIREMAQKEGAVKIVVGIPHPLGDQRRETGQAQEIRRFILDLGAQGLDVLEWDETLSSKVASVQAQDRGGHGKRDDLAAAAILQSWLDRKK